MHQAIQYPRSAAWSRGAAVLLAGLVVACGSSEPPRNGDGFASGPSPGVASGSLYDGPAPRPGPDVLYEPPPRAPQLENTGVWQAEPILISGASAYRGGEFLYQDYIYDDHGANAPEDVLISIVAGVPDASIAGDIFSRPGGTYRYPEDPVYGDNAADLVEFRVRPVDGATAFRVTLNTLNDPERVAFTLALGDSTTAFPAPRGANAHTPAEVFVTVFGAAAEAVDAATGAVLTPAPQVDVDLERRQLQVRVAHAVWNPGQETVPMALGVGLWDAAAGRYLLPAATADATTPGGAIGPDPAAFFNLAFRFDEPPTEVAASLGGDVLLTPAWWRNRRQGEALADNNLGAFRAQVDFAKLHAGADDDMQDTPTGVPTHGPMQRIFASRFEPQPGRMRDNSCGEATGCDGLLSGQLQPYALYVPEREPPEGGFGFTLLLHSLAASYNQYDSSNHQRQLGERGRGYLVATPSGRGPNGWYVETAGADAFEVWADVARHYPLSPDHAAVSGVSMGGYGSFRFATRYPDLFVRIHTIVAPPAVGIWLPPLQPSPGPQSNTFEALESLRNVPVLSWVALADELVPYLGPLTQAQRLSELGYRHRFQTYAPAEHLTFSINDEYGPAADFLGDATVERNPPHVTYVVNPRMDFPEVGMVGDSAYWLSAMTTRDGAPGLVDAFSHGFSVGEVPVLPEAQDVGLLTGGTLPAIAYTEFSRDWGEAPVQAPENRLRLHLRNIDAVTVHPQRAALDCDAVIDIDSDGPAVVRLAGCGREIVAGGD